MPKKKTAIRKARKKPIGDKQKQTHSRRQWIREEFGDGLERLQERNEPEDANQAAARIIGEATHD